MYINVINYYTWKTKEVLCLYFVLVVLFVPRNFQLEKPQPAAPSEEPRRCQAKKENVRPGLDRPLPWPEVLTEVEVIARMRAVKRQRPVRKR